jgi:hypothetical protein
MNIQERIEAFAELGEILRNSLSGEEDYRASGLQELIRRQQDANPWFTPENVTHALRSIAGELTVENLVKWTSKYPDLRDISLNIKTGVIMAGNIPLVGFHDFLSVLISGNILVAKTSSKDSDLIAKIAEILYLINPGFREKIEFTEDHLQDFDVVIATGSNNSSRYFEHYFGRYTHIIRKNRNSIAIIEGNETRDELVSLGSDIFLYFGLGCRNVSKIYIPRGYDLPALTKNWESFSAIISHTKYANNYDFSKAVFIVNKEKFHDTGYILLREESRLSSPVAVLYWEHYDDPQDLQNVISGFKDKIQCIVGSRYTPFGQAQSPRLWDYADGVDTIDFLLKKNKAGIS